MERLGMENQIDSAIELHLMKLPKIEDTSFEEDAVCNRFNEDLSKACCTGNFGAVWMLVFTGATRIRDGIHISIEHGHYQVAALLLICHAVISENISLLDNLLKGVVDFADLIAFLPTNLTVFDKIRSCLKEKEEYTKPAIKVASRSEKTRPTEVIMCLLMNNHCDEKNRKVNWANLGLGSLHNSWVKPIETWVRDLNLSNNNLTVIPECVLNLKVVTRLNLAANNLEKVTNEIFVLPNLRSLNLSRNNLSELPDFPEIKPALKSLNVSSNKLRALPASITRCSMEILNLSNNCFTEVPLCICDITTLKDLDLSDNKEITSLPDMMGKLRNLYHLGLKHVDKITELPDEIKEDAQDVVSTLRMKLRSCQGYYTMKMMVVGKMGQGKTTLVHRLQDDYSYIADNQTEGVEITDLLIKKSAFHRKFTFKVWDFGGHEKYYGTHQCFLSSMSLYLLVWRLIDGENGVHGLIPWLDNIAVRSPGSTVIIVGTHLDCINPETCGQQYVENMKNMVYELTRKPRYKGKLIVPLQGIWAVSCRSGNGKSRNEMNKLRQVIYDTAADIKKGGKPVMGEPIPSSFFSLIDRIEKRKREMMKNKQPPVVRKQEFQAMVKENAQYCRKDIEDSHDVRDATVFLRERGIVMHFDDPNEGLNDLYFVDPSWLCALMARVVTIKSRDDLFSKGIVEVRRTSDLFRRDKLPSEFIPQFIRLLIRFQVAYLLDASRILVPSKLPERLPQDVANFFLPFAPVRRVYKFDYRGIHGFWTRFMSRVFFYMKDMIAVHPINYHESCQSKHGLAAAFCQSCVRVDEPSGLFPCFLETPGITKPTISLKKKEKRRVQISRASSLKFPSSSALISAWNGDPSVRLFSEDELYEDDDVVGIIINNVRFGAKSNSCEDDTGRFRNGYLVLKRQNSVRNTTAARTLRVPSYDNQDSNRKVSTSYSKIISEQERRNEALPTDGFEDQSNYRNEKPVNGSRERTFGNDIASLFCEDNLGDRKRKAEIPACNETPMADEGLTIQPVICSNEKESHRYEMTNNHENLQEDNEKPQKHEIQRVARNHDSVHYGTQTTPPAPEENIKMTPGLQPGGKQDQYNEDSDSPSNTFENLTSAIDFSENMPSPKANGKTCVHQEGFSDENNNASTENKKCALCKHRVPADQLVSIPVDVTELMEKEYLQCWRSGISLRHPAVSLAVSYTSLSDTVIIQSAVSPSPLGRHLLTFIVDHLDTLIKEWYPGLLISFGAKPTIQKLIPCRLCEANKVPEPYEFTFDMCAAKSGVGDIVKCPRHDVSIQDIAPDVVLQDLDSSLVLDEQEIQYDATEADKLGDGSFGAVYRGFCRGKPAAIKEFSTKSEENSTEDFRDIRKEVNVLRHVRQHPFLVSLIGVCLRPFRLVLELADKGSLDKTLFNPDFHIDRVVIYRMIYQVAEALRFLHGLNVIYRNLKPENVLVMSYEEQVDVNIKLTNFGTASFQFSEGLFSTQGSSGYRAPEMLQELDKRTGYNEKVDIFSLGMLIYGFITRRRPFNSVISFAETNSLIIQGEKPRYDDVAVARTGLFTLTCLMEKCLEFNPNLRPSSKSITAQVSSPSFQLHLSQSNLPRAQSIHHVCIVEATRELWVATVEKTRCLILVYDAKNMTVKTEFAIPPVRSSTSLLLCHVKCMHAATTSVLIGLRGDLDAVAIYDLRSYELKTKVILREPVLCLASNNHYFFLGLSSGLLCAVPTSRERNPTTVEVCDKPISSMIAVKNYLWLTSKNVIYIYSTESGLNTKPFELDAVRYSVETSSVTIAALSHHETTIWCSCKVNSIVTCWDTKEKREIYRIHCDSSLQRITKNEFLSPLERCVTCVVYALDTVWVGTGGGILLIIEPRSGELITWMHLFNDRVRSLTLVSEPGPYSADRRFVVASGAHVREETLLCDESAGHPLVPGASQKPKKCTPNVKRARSMNKFGFKVQRKRSQMSENAESSKETSTGGSLLLFEVLPAEVLRRIEAKSPR